MYLVHTEFLAPVGITAGALAELREREAAAARLLQESGVLQSLWREVDTTRAWGLWLVADETELRVAMQALPCSPYMVIDSWQIVAHENSLHPNNAHPRQETTS